MDKNQSPKIYGVLGYPAKHSLSPIMHNEAFKYLNIEAEYKIFEKKPDEISGFLISLYDNNICGLNVTIPYKEAVLKYVQWCSPEVRFTGAANTIIVKNKDYLEGWNTDGLGFHEHLTQELKFDISGKNVIVLGAGGAAKALADQLARHNAKTIAIYDVDINKGAELAKKINAEFPECNATSAGCIEKLDIKNCDLFINATPIGMKDTDPFLLDEKMLHRNLLAYDLIYNPPETKFLASARKAGARAVNGLGMLLYQGARSFELWTGKKAPIEVMRSALEKAVSKL